MRDLAYGGIKDDMLHTLWLNRLPTDIRPLLVTLDKLDLNALAEIADEMMEAMHNPSITVPTSTNRTDSSLSIKQLEARIDELNQILATCLRDIKELKLKTNYRSRSRSKTLERTSTCYYHQKFGADARRCITPCGFTSTSQRN